jgi:ribosomal protein S18 acetylase RimI-like enzyme
VSRTRRADQADAAAIARIQVRAWQAGYRGIVSDDRLDALSVQEVEATWNERLDPAAGRPPFVVVAVEEEEIAGYVVVVSPGRDDDVEKDVAELVALNVDPSWWRHGIGEALMQVALAEFPGECVLWVFPENERALALYARHGFVADGVRKHEPQTACDLVRLRRPALRRA